MSSNDNEFFEVQRFKAWWLYLIVFGISGLNAYIFYEQIIMDNPAGNNPAPDFLVIMFFLIISIFIPLLLLVTNLTIKIRDKTIYYRFFPFHMKYQELGIDAIETAEKVTYRPIRDYGGWGIRTGREGRAYNVAGNEGVRVVTAMGDSILFGSSRSDDLYRAIINKVGVRK